jgi:hypothetical protein
MIVRQGGLTLKRRVDSNDLDSRIAPQVSPVRELEFSYQSNISKPLNDAFS